MFILNVLFNTLNYIYLSSFYEGLVILSDYKS